MLRISKDKVNEYKNIVEGIMEENGITVRWNGEYDIRPKDSVNLYKKILRACGIEKVWSEDVLKLQQIVWTFICKCTTESGILRLLYFPDNFIKYGKTILYNSYEYCRLCCQEGKSDREVSELLNGNTNMRTRVVKNLNRDIKSSPWFNYFPTEEGYVLRASVRGLPLSDFSTEILDSIPYQIGSPMYHYYDLRLDSQWEDKINTLSYKKLVNDLSKRLYVTETGAKQIVDYVCKHFNKLI